MPCRRHRFSQVFVLSAVVSQILSRRFKTSAPVHSSPLPFDPLSIGVLTAWPATFSQPQRPRDPRAATPLGIGSVKCSCCLQSFVRYCLDDSKHQHRCTAPPSPSISSLSGF